LTEDNVHARRRLLAVLIQEGAMDERLLALLFPGGNAIPDEDMYWDYKENFPLQDAEDKSDYNCKMAALAKDVVAFYNVEGGYLVAGVRDSDKAVVGFQGDFDVNDLCKRITGATRAVIDAKYRQLGLEANGSRFHIGILYIPRRSNGQDPVQFLKDAPATATGRKAYSANDIYMRSREECRKATTAEDFSTLIRRDRHLSVGSAAPRFYLENNLPARDPTMRDFVGREEQISDLWRWFTDRYTAVKLLSGPGGVGKTSIAWTFCDAVSQSPPSGIEKVVWLTAKKKTYAAILGEYVEIGHTHFDSLPTLLIALLGELGVPETAIPADPAREELIDEAIAAIKVNPCLLVVDDIDSLNQEEQFDVFRTIAMIFDRVIAGGATRARALMTARLGLSAAPGQLMLVEGMPLAEFEAYVKVTAAAIGTPLKEGSSWKQDVRRLHDASSGSPLFAAAILRLVSLGDSLSAAIKHHAGVEGEEVRRFAFERELDNLSDNQLRVLFAAIALHDCSMMEIAEITGNNRTLVRDDIAILRNYHLLSIAASIEDFAKAEARVTAPAVIVNMSDLIRKKVSDPSRIENLAAKIRREVANDSDAVGREIRRIVSYWQDDDPMLALEAAQHASRKHPKAADLRCMLGRAYLKLDRPDPRAAEAAFRKASELGCVRPEILPLWLEAKEAMEDWTGVIQLTSSRGNETLTPQTVLSLAKAYWALGNDQATAGSWSSAERYFLQGAQEVRRAFEEHRAHGSVEPLRTIKHDLAVAYFDSVRRRVVRPDDKIEVWQAGVSTLEMEVYHRGVVVNAMAALKEWWTAVERRQKADAVSQNLLRAALSALNGMLRKIGNSGPNWTTITTDGRMLRADLERRGEHHRKINSF
jgi:hypothetical protein